MKKILKTSIFFYFLINIYSFSSSEQNFFNKGLKLYNKKKFEDARFMFERSIVFNPKHSNSYLYLAKIYNQEKNQIKEEKCGNNSPSFFLKKGFQTLFSISFQPIFKKIWLKR